MRRLRPAVPEGAVEGQVAIRRVCCQRFGPVGSIHFPRRLNRSAGLPGLTIAPSAPRGLLFMLPPRMARMTPAFQAVACWNLGVCAWLPGVAGEGHRDFRDSHQRVVHGAVGCDGEECLAPFGGHAGGNGEADIDPGDPCRA